MISLESLLFADSAVEDIEKYTFLTDKQKAHIRERLEERIHAFEHELAERVKKMCLDAIRFAV